MADRTRAIEKVLGLGLWNKEHGWVGRDPVGRSSDLWQGVSPSRLGTLGLLKELRDQTRGATARWDPSSRYGHLDNTQWALLDTHFNRLLDQLHPVENLLPKDVETIRGYQKNPHEYPWDRGGPSRSKQQQALYDLLQVTELPVDLTAYRGLSVRSSSSPDRLPLFTTPPREGDVLGTRGFMSTSVDPSSAWDFLSGSPSERSYLADIYLPEGTRALPVRTGDQYDKERELLLSPGTRFRVASNPEPFGEDFENIHRLRLEALHPSDPYQAPEELRTVTPSLDEFKRGAPEQSRGHYAKSGVLGYLAGLGPLAALATPGIMDLYSRDAQAGEP